MPRTSYSAMTQTLETALSILRLATPTPDNSDELNDNAAAKADAELRAAKLAISDKHAAALVALKKERKEQDFFASDARNLKLAVLTYARQLAIRSHLSAGLVVTALKAVQDGATKVHRADKPAKFTLDP